MRSSSRFSARVAALAIVLAGCEESKLAPAASAPAPSPVTPSGPSASAVPVASRPSTAAGRAMDALLGLRSYRDLALSRDGKRVAYSVVLDPIGAPGRRSVFVIELDGKAAAPERVAATSADASSERSPVFSPDGKRLAFVSQPAAGGLPQIWLAELDGGGAPRVVATIQGSVDAPAWSPDGTRLGYLFTERSEEKSLGPGAPTIYDRSAPSSSRRVAVLDVASGEAADASPADLYVHSYAWAPDGRTLVAVASSRARPNYFAAKLYTYSVDGEVARVIHEPKRQIGDPRVSPDGKQVSFIEGLMSDEGNNGGDLFVVPIEGGAAKNLTPGRKATITAARWRPDGRSLVVDEIVEDRFALSSISVDGGESEKLFEAQASFFGLDLSADGETVAFLHTSFDAASSIWSGAPRAPAPIRSTQQRFDKPWGKVEVIRAKSDDKRIQSFLVWPPDNALPPRLGQGARLPLIVRLHGGPAASATAAVNEYLALAADGYFVLLPNPRGSFGQGEAFQEANIRDFGGGDLRDVHASVQAALAAAPIDSQRVGVTGWSYGGFLTLWAVTQGHQFRAAVAGAPIADWQSYWGQTDVTGWMPPYFGATVYDDPVIYAKRSPILFANQVKTPTALMVGERDTDCPVSQSRELWQALAMFGVPTELSVYPGEAHGFSSPAHRRDRIERMSAWFGRHMPP